MICLMMSSINAISQTYIRYEMNDDSFHGFYSDQVDSIGHTIIDGERVQVVYQKNSRRVIPLNSIRSVSFESITLDDASAVGEYRIYELDLPDEEFKKIYVDNRAVLLASKNGDFGANDTLLFSSAYNGLKALMYTDSLERVRKFFDGEHLFVYDYNEDGSVDVINFNGDNIMSGASHGGGKTKAALTKSFKGLDKLQEFVNTHIDLYKKNKRYQECVDFDVDRIIELSAELSMIKFNLDNDPELHKERLLYHSLSVTGDLVSIGASLWSIVTTGGVTTPLLAYEIYDLYSDMENLLDELYPSWAQKKIFTDYYAKKHGVSVLTLPVVCLDHLPTEANLYGSANIPDNVENKLYFEIKNVTTNSTKLYSAYESRISGCQYDVVGIANGLVPNTEYMCNLMLILYVDGLDLMYKGGVQSFYTPDPGDPMWKWEYSDVTSTSVDLILNYENIYPESEIPYSVSNYGQTLACLNYWVWDDNWGTIKIEGSGQKTINVTHLFPDASYEIQIINYPGPTEWLDYVFRTEHYPGIPSGTWYSEMRAVDGFPIYTTYYQAGDNKYYDDPYQPGFNGFSNSDPWGGLMIPGEID